MKLGSNIRFKAGKITPIPNASKNIPKKINKRIK